MVTQAFVTFAVILFVGMLFAIPLILKFRVFKPEVKHVATGEVFQVSGKISPTWCQAVELSSNTKFRSFLYESDPRVNVEEIERTVTHDHITLPNRGQEIYDFHLLRGSRVNISACVRLFEGDLTVVKGHRAARRCLAEHRYIYETYDDVSKEDSLSESESEDVTSSISSSQGAPSNETDRMYICKDAIYHVQIPHAYACRASQNSPFLKKTLYHFIEHTDYYYYIFSSDTYLNIPNEFSIRFTIDRTHYNHTESYSKCTTSEFCQLNISMTSYAKIVVEMHGINGSLNAEKLTVVCQAREWLFVIFYIGFFVLIFFGAFQ